jgi:hypothetical protein
MVNEKHSSSNKRGGAAASAEVVTAAMTEIQQLRESVETWRMLTELGEFGESYGDIVKRVTRHYMSCPEVKRKKQKE